MNERNRSEGQPLICFQEDCGNAPRKKLLLDLAISFARGELEPIMEQLSDRVVWKRVGIGSIEGKEAVVKVLDGMKTLRVKELHVEHLLTHGNEAAISGLLVFGDGGGSGDGGPAGSGWPGGLRRSFCALFKFGGFSKSARINEITTYVIGESRE